LHSDRRLPQEQPTDPPPALKELPNPWTAQSLNVLIKIPVIITAQIGKPAERIHSRWHEPLQDGDHFLPDLVPEIDRFVITGVVPKPESFIGKIGEDRIPFRLVQWPDDDSVATCRHTGEAGQPRTPKHPEKNRLRLIVGRMPDGDSIRATLLCDVMHGTIA
jgi:hypothetical protein